MKKTTRAVLSVLALAAATLASISPASATIRISAPAANTWSSVRTDSQPFTNRWVSGKVMRSTGSPHNVIVEPTANVGDFRTRVSISCWNGSITSGWVTASFPAAGVVFTYCPDFADLSYSGWGEIDAL